MIDVTDLFLIFSGVVFLGFILNALFYKLKILVTLPLMIIGILIGPVFHLIAPQGSGILIDIASLVSAIAIAFILFDVGLRIDISELELFKATRFFLPLSIVTGIVLGILIGLFTGWNPILSFIIGFALAGPSSAIFPTLSKIARINKRLNNVLVFESVASDSVQLIIPLILIALLQTNSFSISSISSAVFYFFVLSSILGVITAFVWTFILQAFNEYSKEYSWMLTITVVIANYGVAQFLGLNSGVTVFVFGIIFANLPKLFKNFDKYFYNVRVEFGHINEYQKEITFFISTFFFVYIGTIISFNTGSLSLSYIIAISLVLTAAIVLIRKASMPVLEEFFVNKNKKSSERILSIFDVGRGLSPIIIGLLLINSGLNIDIYAVLGLIFITVFITNIIETIGIFFYADASNKEKNTDMIDSTAIT
ncbi:MAG: cation:proton antiporter [Candidatus Micrarchaeia archaeon]